MVTYASSAKAWEFKVSQLRQHGKTLYQMKGKKKKRQLLKKPVSSFTLSPVFTPSPLKPGARLNRTNSGITSNNGTEAGRRLLDSLLFDSCTPTSTPHLCCIPKVHWKPAQPPLMNSHTSVSIRPHPLGVSFYPANCFLAVSIRVSSKQTQRWLLPSTSPDTQFPGFLPLHLHKPIPIIKIWAVKGSSLPNSSISLITYYSQ